MKRTPRHVEDILLGEVRDREALDASHYDDVKQSSIDRARALGIEEAVIAALYPVLAKR